MTDIKKLVQASLDSYGISQFEADFVSLQEYLLMALVHKDNVCDVCGKEIEALDGSDGNVSKAMAFAYDDEEKTASFFLAHGDCTNNGEIPDGANVRNFRNITFGKLMTTLLDDFLEYLAFMGKPKVLVLRENHFTRMITLQHGDLLINRLGEKVDVRPAPIPSERTDPPILLGQYALDMVAVCSAIDAGELTVNNFNGMILMDSSLSMNELYEKFNPIKQEETHA